MFYILLILLLLLLFYTINLIYSPVFKFKINNEIHSFAYNILNGPKSKSNFDF